MILDEKYLASILIKQGFINEELLNEMLEVQKNSGGSLKQILINGGYLTEQEILLAIGAEFNMEPIRLDGLEIPPFILEKLTSSIARIYNIIPVKFENNVLTVAVSDPFNQNIMDDLKFMLDCDIKFVLSPEEEILKAIEVYYGEKSVDSISEFINEVEKDTKERKDGELSEDDISDVSTLESRSKEAPIIKLLNLILLQAIKDKASDIHFEPYEDKFRVRVRVDGVLCEISSPPKYLSLPLISRIKVMARLNIAERRFPQDGKIRLRIAGRDVDIRVSTIPTVFGESAVLRLLDKSVVSLDINKLGFPEHIIKHILKLIEMPNGIFIVTGPTGSGKTTTLYSCLNKINKIEDKIITTEDPVEYDIDGLMQINIIEEIGLTFARCLRSILRQDPDIIMVGEIRDVETAQIAIQASLTGHLVLSTLHTNDAPGAITRLIDMGVEPFLISSTVRGVLAQRLVRKICDNCSTAVTPEKETLMDLGFSRKQMEDTKFYFGKGCSVCNNTGYKGRSSICELLLMSDELRELINQKAPSSELMKCAQKKGMTTMREHGLDQVFNGITSLEELLKETQH